MTRTRRLILRAALVGIGIVLLGLAVGVTPASAHDFLIRTSPQAGDNLRVSPVEIVLDFSGTIQQEHLRIRRSNGSELQPISVGVDDTNARLRAAVPTLANGAYRIEWAVTATDGHDSEGEFVFGVNAKVGPGATVTSSADSTIGWLDAIVQLALVAGLALALGGLLSEQLFWSATDGSDRIAAPAAIGLGAGFCGAVAGVAIAIRRAGTSSDGWARFVVTHQQPRLLALVAVLTAVALPLRRVRGLRWVVIALSAAAVVAVVAAGHASTSVSRWVTPTTQVHVVVAAAWVGAVAHLGLAARERAASNGSLEKPAAAYSRWAIIAAPVAIGLGSLAAVLRFDSPAQLVTTLYGRILLAKIAMVAFGIWVAWSARRRGIPADEQRISRLAQLVRRETICLAAVLVLSATLAATTAPSPHGGIVLGPVPLAGPVVSDAALVGNHLVLAEAATDRLLIRVTPPGGAPTTDMSVTLDVVGPDRQQIEVYPHDCGAGCLDLAHQWKPGITTVVVTVKNPHYDGGVESLHVAWPPGAVADDLLTRVVDRMRHITVVGVTETVTSGPAATSGPYRLTESGNQIIDSQPYARGADNVRRSADENGLQVVTFTVNGAGTWHRLWIDGQDRIRAEVLIDAGHQIRHDFDYPAAGR